MNSQFLWQCKREEITAGCDCKVLLSIYRITHGRCMDHLANVEVPQSFAGAPTENHKILRVIAERHQPRCGRHDTAPALTSPDLCITPCKIELIQIEGVDIPGGGLRG